MPDRNSFLSSQILFYELCHHMGMRNLLSGTYFSMSVSQWHQAIFCELHGQSGQWNSIKFYIMSFSITASGLCLYHFSFAVISYFWQISQWIFVPNQSYLCFYSFQAILLYLLLLITCLMLSSAFTQQSTFTVFFLKVTSATKRTSQNVSS